MNENKFIIVTPAYKVSKWIELYVNMLKFQSYKNFEVYFVDDDSPDDTVEKLKKVIDGDSRFHIHVNEISAKSPLANIVKATELANPNDEDIIVNIDGDDWLSSVFVLQYLNKIYNQHNCWMTYGTCQLYPSGEIVGHANIDMPDEVSDKNMYRKFPFIMSHLRTYKAWLYNKIDKRDFIDSRTNKIYTEASDVALIMPMAEMAGKNKICRIHDILYILNRENALNEATINFSGQKESEHIIRTQHKVYDRLKEY